jgi:hypothetical protein
VRAIVVGLNHWIQRNQDDIPDRNLKRQVFARSVRRFVEQQRIQLVAEEAGDDERVAAGLQRDEDNWARCEGRPPRRFPAIEPISKAVVDQIDSCRHADIHPGTECGADFGEYERAMTFRLLENLGGVVRVAVLCGEDHRVALSETLRERSWDVESRDIEWLLASYGGQEGGR